MTIEKLCNVPDEADSRCDASEYIARQTDAFDEALDAMNVTGGFPSLTAGLDTRAIFCGLLRRNCTIPSRTLIGESMTVDGAAARDLCLAYGVDHEMIRLNNSFRQDLPSYAAKASLLSGGSAGIEQAHEVYFHEAVSQQFSTRVSGNLGNQLGRHGLERIATRRTPLTFLHPDVVGRRTIKAAMVHETDMRFDGFTKDWPLLEETLFSNIANYCIGSSYCVQRSPYAKRRLIQLAPYRPFYLRFPKRNNYWRNRAAQIRHLFIGEPVQCSFQRRMIVEVGGFSASYPVNWGWRPYGGITWRGLTRGILACADAIGYKLQADSWLIQRVTGALAISGMHEFCPYRRWLRQHRDFVADSILSRAVNDCGLFNIPRTKQIVEQYWNGKIGVYGDVMIVLDLALAQQQFCASL
jgi:hypothetical protein